MRNRQAETVAVADLAAAVLMVEVLGAQELQEKEMQGVPGITLQQYLMAAAAAAAQEEQEEMQLLL